MSIVVNGSGTITGISTGGLPDNTVDAGTLASNAVTAAKLATDSVTAAKLATDSVTAAKLASDSVTAAKIAANSVDSAELVAGAIDDSHMASISGRRNMIINGAMNVSQRGTSTTGVGSKGFFACDRVKLYAGSNGGGSSSRYTVTQSTNSPTGFNHSYKMHCTTANASPSAGHNTLLRLGIIEKQDLINTKFGTSSAESLTLSFWVKSNITGSQQVLIVNHVHQKQAGGTFTINSVDTWEKKTITVSGDVNYAFDTTNPTSLAITVDMFLEAGSDYYGGTAQGSTWGDRTNNTKAVNRLNISSSTSNYFQITGVQLELGSTATNFEYRSYGEELALCQRYFYNVFHNTTTKVKYQITQYSASGNAGWTVFQVPYPVPMRGSPTFTHSMTNAKCQGGNVGNGSDEWTYYTQNQGYGNMQGNGNASTFSGGGTEFGGIGTYYVSSASSISSHIMIASGTTFQFDAEL